MTSEMKSYTKLLLLALCCFFPVCRNRTPILAGNTSNMIAFHRNPDAGGIWDFNVWLIDINTGKEIQLTKDLRYWEYNPVWLSDSEILYLSEPQEKTMTTKNMVIYSLRTGTRRILQFWEWWNDPSMDKVSLDDSGNVYYSAFIAPAKQYGLYRMSLRQHNPKPEMIMSPSEIENLGLTCAFNPVVSRTGKKMLVVASDSVKQRRISAQGVSREYYDIYLCDIEPHTETNQLMRLTNGDSTHKYPAWLDSSRFIMSSNMDGNYELYLMNVDGTGTRRLTFSSNTEDTRPAASPDGKHIAYSKYDTGANRYEIWIMNLDNLETWFLTEGWGPDWSPAK